MYNVVRISLHIALLAMQKQTHTHTHINTVIRKGALPCTQNHEHIISSMDLAPTSCVCMVDRIPLHIAPVAMQEDRHKNTHTCTHRNVITYDWSSFCTMEEETSKQPRKALVVRYNKDDMLNRFFFPSTINYLLCHEC